MSRVEIRRPENGSRRIVDSVASCTTRRSKTAPQPLPGLSNWNYLVRSDGVEHVVRLANDCPGRFGIDRQAEEEALRLASKAGLGPEVVHYTLPKGHMITKAIPARGVGQDPDRHQESSSLQRITRAVKRIHELPAIGHRFDPIDRIRTALGRAAECTTPLPSGFEDVLTRLDEIETRRGNLSPEETALCHNDLLGGNILNCDPVRIIDWEFASVGDIFFDLATLAVACDEFNPLSDVLIGVILQAYSGEVVDAHTQRLEDLIFVVQLHVVAWGLTHRVLGTPPQGWEGFTFLGFGTDLLEHLMQNAKAWREIEPYAPRTPGLNEGLPATWIDNFIRDAQG